MHSKWKKCAERGKQEAQAFEVKVEARLQCGKKKKIRNSNDGDEQQTNDDCSGRSALCGHLCVCMYVYVCVRGSVREKRL